jgi:hypothetical protein
MNEYSFILRELPCATEEEAANCQGSDFCQGDYGAALATAEDRQPFLNQKTKHMKDPALLMTAVGSFGHMVLSDPRLRRASQV